MDSITILLIFVPILATIFLLINFLLAPHKPNKDKDSQFECGFSSFTQMSRLPFSISFFIYALLFLLFDLEILLVYPYVVSAYNNSIYGLIIMLIFFILLTIGFVFELGKKALQIESRQTNENSFRNSVSERNINNNNSFSKFYNNIKVKCIKLFNYIIIKYAILCKDVKIRYSKLLTIMKTEFNSFLDLFKKHNFFVALLMGILSIIYIMYFYITPIFCMSPDEETSDWVNREVKIESNREPNKEIDEEADEESESEEAMLAKAMEMSKGPLDPENTDENIDEPENTDKSEIKEESKVENKTEEVEEESESEEAMLARAIEMSKGPLNPESPNKDAPSEVALGKRKRENPTPEPEVEYVPDEVDYQIAREDEENTRLEEAIAVRAFIIKKRKIGQSSTDPVAPLEQESQNKNNVQNESNVQNENNVQDNNFVPDYSQYQEGYYSDNESHETSCYSSLRGDESPATQEKKISLLQRDEYVKAEQRFNDYYEDEDNN